MKAILTRVLIGLYSKEWRSRYEKEFTEFLSETPASCAIVWDVAVSGIRESMTRRLRRRADTLRGVVLGTRRSRVQIGAMLLGIAAFSLVAEATPRWTLHRAPENFRVWSGDGRIRYEPGTENVAAAVSAVLPAAISSTEYAQYKACFPQPLLIYICANETTATAYRRAARLDDAQGARGIYIAASLGNDRRSALISLIAQWHDRWADVQSPINRPR